MSPTGPKRLRMFAGPNGSGKTRLTRQLAREFAADGLFQLHHYVNSDDLNRQLQQGQGIPVDFLEAVSAEKICTAMRSGGRLPLDHPFFRSMQIVHGCLTAPASVCDGYVAAAIADFFHEELLAANKSFSFETVMSHPSKVALFARARAQGYRTYLYFIATGSPRINIYRVKERMDLGGHDVPADKIVERYQRSLTLVRDALANAFRAFFFDNSGDEPIWLAECTPGQKMTFKVAESTLPEWFRTWVLPAR
jgi:predicted ABC-type ATPase